jgi:hypothetical protein
MKTTFKRFAAALGLALIGMILTAKAGAECGSYLLGHKAGAVVSPQSWSGAEVSSASLLLVSEHDSNDSIVGMWKFTLTAQGNTGPGAPPDGVPLDIGFTQWHSDGTEIINSGRPPQDGSICLGVWEKTGKSRYKFNHFATGYDTANAPSGIGNPTGPTHIVGDVMVSRDGKHYAGTFTLDAYDTSNTLIAHLVGVITATRITVRTPASSIF